MSHTKTKSAAQPPHADYGIDAPPVVRNLILGGLAWLLLAGALHLIGKSDDPGMFRALYRTGLYAGPSWIVSALLMIYGSRVRKLKLRDRLLDELALRGDEQVLDVGCGRGLMLLGAARRLPRGRAFGIDLWQTVDQSGNSPDATRKNAAAEGVDSRIELYTGDARAMPFPDGQFDCILSSWALHNIPDKRGRAAALGEIARVLKPGGRLLIVDIIHSSEYVKVLHDSGLADVRRKLVSLLFIIPSFRIDAKKPGPQ
jgi:SAM-dependent methyltransferase